MKQPFKDAVAVGVQAFLFGFLLTILFGLLVSCGGYTQTVIERLKTSCEASDSTWTTHGCTEFIFTIGEPS